MALIRCKECGNEISDLAKTCPHCGSPTNPESEDLKNLGSGLQNLGAGCSSFATIIIVVGLVILALGMCSKMF